MSSLPPRIEWLARQPDRPDFPDKPRWPRRLIVFLGVFVPVALAGLAYVWIRPPVYESRATLLTVAPIVIDQPGNRRGETSVVVQDTRGNTAEHVTLQKQMLLGPSMLQAVHDRLRLTEEISAPSLAELEALLTVTPFPDTNVVELRARGSDDKLLPVAVNAWIDAYQEMRAQLSSSAENQAIDALRLEIGQLESKVESKRQALDLFRRTHDILSKEEVGNQAVSELRGLNDALNQANAEETKAKARIDAARQAIARGETIAPPEERASMANLEQRAQALREKLTELKRRYTNSYIGLEPQLKVIPEQLREIEKEIAQKSAQGQKDEIAAADRAYEAARQTTQAIRAQIETHKRKVAEFTTRFAQHEALQNELTDMEDLYRKAQEQLLNLEVTPRDTLPQLSVVDGASAPGAPVWPDYRRDSAIVAGLALALALFAVWLYEFLTARPHAPGHSPLHIPDIRVYSVPENLVLARQNAEAQSLPEQRAPALEQGPPRELTETELLQLVQHASVKARQLIVLLLSGLSLDEAARLRATDIDRVKRCIVPPGVPARELILPPGMAELFTGHQPFPAWGDCDTEELEALISCAAIDAGLPNPEEVDAAVLRHTYILYLVRQGIRLAELEHIVGALPAKTLAGYGRYSPPGPGLPCAAVDRVHPVLKNAVGPDKTL